MIIIKPSTSQIWMESALVRTVDDRHLKKSLFKPLRNDIYGICQEISNIMDCLSGIRNTVAVYSFIKDNMTRPCGARYVPAPRLLLSSPNFTVRCRLHT